MRADVRAALLFALWHHQGGSSQIGQSIREMLGMGQFDRLSDADIEAAKSFAPQPAEAKQQGPGEAVRGVCHWSQQDEGYEVFSTSCGHEYEVNDGRDGNVSLPFCPFCARRLEGSAWTPGDDEDDAAPQVEAKRQTGDGE